MTFFLNGNEVKKWLQIPEREQSRKLFSEIFCLEMGFTFAKM